MNISVMQASERLPNIANIKYPCLATRLPFGKRVYYNKGFFCENGLPLEEENKINKFKILQGLNDYVLDGYLVTDTLGLRFHVIDCVPSEDWQIKHCNIPYEERLRTLRVIINQIADYTSIIDLFMEQIEGPQQIKLLFKETLTKQQKGILIYDVNGIYEWNKITTDIAPVYELRSIGTLVGTEIAATK